VDKKLLGVAVVSLVVILVQFLPVYREFPAPLDIAPGWGLFSPTPGKALESALFYVSVLSYFFMLNRLPLSELKVLLPFIFVGLFVNLVIGVTQLGFASDSAIMGLLPFTMRLGMFANVIHFGTLVYMAIPILAWRFLYRSRQPAVYGLITGFLVLLQFAGGSTAAMGISAILAVGVVPFFVKVPKRFFWPALLALIGVGIFAVFLIMNRDTEALSENQRLEIFSITLKGIFDNLFLGSGLGSFLQIYPIYEPVETIKNEYTNHAHNDYLELWLELGIVFPVLLACYGLLLLQRFPTSKFRLAAWLSAMAVLAHTMVDYPMRTMAIAMLFAFMNAIVFHKDADEPVEKRSRRRRSG